MLQIIYKTRNNRIKTKEKVDNQYEKIKFKSKISFIYMYISQRVTVTSVCKLLSLSQRYVSYELYVVKKLVSLRLVNKTFTMRNKSKMVFRYIRKIEVTLKRNKKRNKNKTDLE